MAFVQYESKIVPKNSRIDHSENSTNTSSDHVEYYIAVANERTGLNVLGLVMFCLTFGIVLSRLGSKGKFLIEFFEAINEAFVKLIGIVMMYAKIT